MKPTSMTEWKSIEELTVDQDIWVISYLTGRDEPDGPWTGIHGWYASEPEALAVWKHFPNRDAYDVHKVHRRILIPTP